VTLLDDDMLGTLLHEVGDSFAVPETGIADTLRRVRHGDEERQAHQDAGEDHGQIAFALGEGATPPAPRSFRRVILDHRLLSVAASLLVLAAIASGALLWGSTKPPARTASTALAAPRHAASAPPTQKTTGAGAGTSTQYRTSDGTPGATGATNSTGATGAANSPTFTGAAGAPGSNAPSTTPSPIPNGAVGQSAKIEQTGSLTLLVPHGALSTTMSKLTALATASGGFVARSQSESADGAPTGSLTVQVPEASFSSVLAQSRSLGKVSAVTTKATDVTGQYVDLQARITALETSRQQYLTIMSSATTIGDVLAVQTQLDALQSQIEQLQGQLSVLDNETTYSTWTFTVNEAVPAHHHHHVAPVAESGLSKAWHASVHGFAAGFNGLIRVAGPILFALLCLGVVLLGGKLFWRRLQRHNL
jgi:Domain of unknown function (DUF4349)